MSPALTKVNIDYMISQLFVEFEKSGAATAIDMEVVSEQTFVLCNHAPFFASYDAGLRVIYSLLTRYRTSIRRSCLLWKHSLRSRCCTFVLDQTNER